MTGQPAYTDADVHAAEVALALLSRDGEVARIVLDAVVPGIVARAKAEALREFADHIQRPEWPMPPDVGHVAMEAHACADEIEAGR